MANKRWAWLIASAGLAGCSMTPAYRPAAVAVPKGFAETPGWTDATPLDGATRGAWWHAFHDPVLDDLETRAQEARPTLAVALARYDQARASQTVSAAALLPEVDAGGSAARARLAQDRPLSPGAAAVYNDFRVGGQLSYEVDLWGRVRASIAAARAETAASAGDLASARLSLQADVADAYVRLRGLDAQADLLDRTISAYTKALELTTRRHDGGIASAIDVNRSRTVLANARAQVSATAAMRDATEHELAALVGAVASSFHVAPDARLLAPPPVPVGTPSQLLQRRPDIAAAERRMAEANARIGVARAGLFPSITLGLTGGYETTGDNLISAPNAYWGLGPLSINLPVFDAGKRRATVRLSRAQYEEMAADYRASVLAAFRQTEDALAAARLYAREDADQLQAAQAAERTSDLAYIRYREGAATYLEVVTAQTDALTARRLQLAVATQRVQTAIALVRALGGEAAPAKAE